jgi:two-component system LytT family response regulator
MNIDDPRRRCIIVDDEPMARRFLAGLLERYLPELSLAGEADSVDSALALIRDVQPQLVFLDSEIIGGRGIDVLRLLPDTGIRCIVCTADPEEFPGHHEIAVLLKPIDITALIGTVRRSCWETPPIPLQPPSASSSNFPRP